LLTVALPFRPSYEYLTGTLLCVIADGVVLLVLNAVTAESTLTAFGLLAAAVGLVLAFSRIWRGTNDATRWTAVILAALAIPFLW
jgi:uncharacterized membrane protein HdeD (DUF308 family)